MKKTPLRNQRMLENVTRTRAELRGFPDPAHESAFRNYSSALRELVKKAVAWPEALSWGMADDSWYWDGYSKSFHFKYDGWASLTRSADANDHENMFTQAQLTFDPNVELEAELVRVAAHAKFFRDAVELMEQELYRSHVRKGDAQ